MAGGSQGPARRQWVCGEPGSSAEAGAAAPHRHLGSRVGALSTEVLSQFKDVLPPCCFCTASARQVPGGSVGLSPHMYVDGGIGAVSPQGEMHGKELEGSRPEPLGKE